MTKVAITALALAALLAWQIVPTSPKPDNAATRAKIEAQLDRNERMLAENERYLAAVEAWMRAPRASPMPLPPIPSPPVEPHY